MLKGIHPLLNADLLHVLAAMGHGDELALVDANFPAASVARKLVRLDGVDTPTALQAILTLFPLDSFVPSPVAVMQVVGDPDAVPPPVRDVQPIVDAAMGKPLKLDAIDRFAFYERARKAFAVVATGEPRGYGNVLLTKGVIAIF